MRKTIKTLLLLAATILVTAFSAAAADELLLDMNTTGLTTKNVEVTQEYINLYDSSRKMIHSGTGTELRSEYSPAKDLSGCNYFNIWAYSPEVSTLRFTIDVNNEVNGTDTLVGRYTVTANWKGWKLVSVPFADFSLQNDVTSVDWSAVTRYRVTNYSTAWDGWAEGDFLCIDKIWCSTEDPYAVAGSELIIDYNNATRSIFGVADTTRVSEKSLKLSSDTSRVEATCTLDNPIDISSCNYINMWVYLPAQPVRNDKEDNPILVIRLVDGSTTPVSAQSQSACTDMKLNWQGWKLITAEINSTNFSNTDTLDKSKISAFKVITNNNTTWNSFKESVDIYFDKIWFSKEAPTAAAPEITNVVSANGDSNFRSLDSAIELSVDKNAILKDASAFTVTADGGASVSATPYLIAPEKVALFLGNTLADNTNYTVKIAADALLDGDGFGNEATTLDFTTRPVEFKADTPTAYDYAAKLTAGTATERLKAVTKLYNTTAEAKNVMLLVAVYGSDGAMKDVAIKQHTVNPSTQITADTVSKLDDNTYTYASAGSGDSVRCFILEDNLAPVSLNE